MKKFFLIIISLLVYATSLHAATVTRYSGSRIFWDSRTPTTIFSGGGYARLIELRDGRLLSCCESGGIKIAFSSNNGRTWTAPKLIAPNANNTPNCVPDLIQLADGTIIVAYNPRPSQPYSAERRFGIRLRRSTDNGRTWSEEVFVYDADSVFENGCWEPSLLELPSGELQLYFADESPYTSSGEQQISLSRSFDGGLTWSAPQRVSFRAGYRDGMPVPVMLGDGKNIVVAIEDNGWSGVGDFLPTTVRTSLSGNWKNNSYVSGASTLRNRSINYDYCPMAKGGAPYLRVLPSGETILSHQSRYGSSDNMKMYVYVGNDQAKDFKAMSMPFMQDSTKNCWWNSLAVIDTGIVVAIGGMDGKIVMAKGYPMKQFVAPFGTPKMDGLANASDAYYSSSGHQIPLAGANGTFSYTDFSYDLDSLYAVFTIYRSKPRWEEPFPDGVNFYVESKGLSTDVPMASAYRFNILPNGTVSASQGNRRTWVAAQAQGVHVVSVTATAYYRLEVAIPWTAVGLSAPPIAAIQASPTASSTRISVNFEIINAGGEAQTIESIPDAAPLKPATWMLLKLIEPDPTGIKAPEGVGSRKGEKGATMDASVAPAYDLSGKRLPCDGSSAALTGKAKGIIIRAGRKIAVK